jgi:hypothetical protein
MRRASCAAVFLLVLSPLLLPAESVTAIRNNGPSANRVDLVVLGDGYTAAEMDKYAADVETFVLAVFSVEPFKEYARYFNVLRVDVVSNESGADKPASNIYKDTALDAYYYCNQTQRLICVNTYKVYSAINRSGLAADQQDMILVLVNDPEYGGSGGAVAVASTHSSCLELILHEQGHSFGLLADEYDYPPPTCVNTVEPSNVNATMEKDRTKIKWNPGGGPPSGWIDPSTPVPTTGVWASGVPGLYEGAKYCTTGLYRPTYNSLMRTLSHNYEQVNTEQLIKRIYNWVSGLDSWSPVQPAVTLAPGEKRSFQVTTTRPASHDLDIAWTMDGARVGIGPQYVVESSGGAYGSHELKAEIHDPTPLVRSDPSAALTDARTWTVTGYFSFATLKIASAEGGTTDPAPGNHVFAAGATSVIRAIPAASYAFAGWTGDVPAGHELDNPLTVVMNTVVSLRATFRKTLLAPINASVEKTVNRSLSQAEYINVIKFAFNPASSGVAGYRIYRIDGPTWVEIASLGPNTFQYADRGVMKLREYTYAIVAFSASDQESDPAFVVAR